MADVAAHSATPEMRARVETFDWSRTALGPRESWPASLTLCVDLILSSGFPMAVRWGPDLIMIYNDGYRSILGDKHPMALGLPFREAWPEVQHQLGPLHHAILVGEQAAIFNEDLLIRVKRYGRWEDGRFTVSYGPIPDPTAPSGIGGVLITVVETTERVRMEEALRESSAALADRENSLRLFLNSANSGFYCIDRDGRTTMCNAGFCRMLGFADESEAIGHTLHDVIHNTRPDGSPYAKEDCPISRCARDGTPAHVEFENFYRLDGTAVPVEYWVDPIVQDGELRGAVCTFADISERKQADELRAVLTRELQHRIKNTLTVVQAIVGQSLRGTESPRDATHTINQRLFALGRAHDLLTAESWRAASMTDVVSRAVALHQEGFPRIHASGPALLVGARIALSLTMVLHELCTNAVKYGALSVEAGRVDIGWRIDRAQFHLEWKESGGPDVTPPTRKGFGSRLISGSFDSGDDTHSELLYEKSGVVWRLHAPLTVVQEQ
ncbi:MAG: HWE histidine kinase domain-containing protein [Rhizomicrobium sp.]